MGYPPRDLDEYSRRELQAELARREEKKAQGLCDYCGRSGLVEPACKFLDRHNEAGMQMQRLNQIAAGIPQVGVTEVRFHDQRHDPLRFQNPNRVSTLDTEDRGRFQ